MYRAFVVMCLAIGIFVAGCQGQAAPPKESFFEALLKGEHKLRKMAERTTVDSRISGSFFLFVGDLQGSTSTNVAVKFAWEMNDGVYAISSLPLEKIRVRLDEKATSPTIKFRWSPSQFREPVLQKVIDRYVVYAVVTVRESDWPVQVRLPLNDK